MVFFVSVEGSRAILLVDPFALVVLHGPRGRFPLGAELLVVPARSTSPCLLLGTCARGIPLPPRPAVHESAAPETGSPSSGMSDLTSYPLRGDNDSQLHRTSRKRKEPK
jgi:hypothetical protein